MRPLSRAGATHHLAGMTLDLTDDEARALAKHLRHALDDARNRWRPGSIR
jgi:hypothetical protein